MRQHVSNDTQQNITPEVPNAIARMQALIEQTLASIFHHVKQIKPAAALAIALFLAVAFTFAVRGDLQNQGLATARLPVKEQVKPDTAAAPIAEVKPDTTPAPPRYIAGSALKKMAPLPPQKVDTETLWLARVIYSETNRPEEQELVAWVIRNRMETEYRGKDTYQEVALDPYQFSAFNPGTATRHEFTSLTTKSKAQGFQKALAIAHQVKNAPDSVRPFPETTRHFYSQQSMVGGRTPSWARGKNPVTPERDFTLEAKRFRFYKDIG